MYAEEAVKNANNIRGALAVLATLHLTSYKYPLSANVTDGATYDYIVVGAGAAGSVVANRLSEDPNVSVLLIEAGGDPPIESNLPGLLGYCTKSYLDWNHKSQVDGEAFKCHRNSQLHLSHGKVLGGTSSINYMFYTRGDPNDYNTWAKLTGDESWNYSNVLPYFKKSERFEGNSTDNPHFEIFHGTDGYLGVTKLSHEIKYSSSLKELGYSDDLDTNSNYTLGFSQQTLTLANGKRQGTAEAFLSNIKERKNLHIEGLLRKPAKCYKPSFEIIEF